MHRVWGTGIGRGERDQTRAEGRRTLGSGTSASWIRCQSAFVALSPYLQPLKPHAPQPFPLSRPPSSVSSLAQPIRSFFRVTSCLIFILFSLRLIIIFIFSPHVPPLCYPNLSYALPRRDRRSGITPDSDLTSPAARFVDTEYPKRARPSGE